MANNKAGHTMAIRAAFKGRTPPTDVIFKVVGPTAQAKVFRADENPELSYHLAESTGAHEYELKYKPDIPGQYSYVTRAIVDGSEVEATGGFEIDPNPVNIQREVAASVSEAVEPERKTIHEMLSFDVPYSAGGTMPDVPLAPGVDIEAIRANDPNPLFVVRPVGVLGAVSENGLLYDDYLLSEIERQIIEKRPPARQGHVPSENKSWSVPDSAGFWVGALRQGDTLYGKCYILPNRPFHDEVQVNEAVGGQIGNSIYGDATLSVGEDGQMQCVGLALESIDFVPPERAALQALGGEFEVTREMIGEMDMAGKEDKEPMSTDQKKAIAEAYLKECNAAMVKEMLSEAQRKAVASDCVKEMQPTDVSEMLSEAQMTHCAELNIGKIDPNDFVEKLSEDGRKGLAESLAKGLGMKLTREDDDMSETSIAEMRTMKATVSELQAAIKRYERQDFERALDAAVAGKFSHLVVKTDDGKRKIATLIANLRPQVVAEMAGSTKIEDIEPAATRAYESAAFKPLAEMTIQSLSGPSAFVGVTSVPGQASDNRFGWDPQTGRYSDDAVAKAQQRTNLVNRGGN